MVGYLLQKTLGKFFLHFSILRLEVIHLSWQPVHIEYRKLVLVELEQPFGKFGADHSLTTFTCIA